MDMSLQPLAAPPALEHSDQSKSEASAIVACIFSQLPHDLQLRVLASLASLEAIAWPMSCLLCKASVLLTADLQKASGEAILESSEALQHVF